MKNSFKKIIGYEKEKTELLQIADILKHREIYAPLGVAPPCGLLLYGEPGVGKTLMAKCLIEASGLHAITCRKDQAGEGFVDTIKSAYTKAGASAPSIVFLDDLDKFANMDYDHTDTDEYVAVQACIDNCAGKGVFTLATANDINRLPRSLTRSGRFDRKMEIPDPKPEDAAEIIKFYLRDKIFVEDVNTLAIARIMNGESCARIETVINEAGIIAGYERADAIKMEHIMRACLRIIHGVDLLPPEESAGATHPDPNQRSRLYTACHEAGHVTIAEVLKPHSVTVTAMHDAKEGSAGFTSIFDADAHLPDGLKRTLTIALGGMTAMEQVFGIEDAGNSMDLKRASSLAKMISEEFCFYGLNTIDFGYDTSESRRDHIERISCAILEKHYRKAREILIKNRDFLRTVSDQLLTRSMLLEKDIAEIRTSCPTVPVVLD